MQVCCLGNGVKFGLDAGIYNVNAVSELGAQPILTVGFGVKVPIG